METPQRSFYGGSFDTCIHQSPESFERAMLMEQMKEEIADLYNLNHYKEMITEYAVELGNEHTTENTAAEIAKRLFVAGYMQAVSELTDRYSLLLADGFKGR